MKDSMSGGMSGGKKPMMPKKKMDAMHKEMMGKGGKKGKGRGKGKAAD